MRPPKQSEAQKMAQETQLDKRADAADNPAIPPPIIPTLKSIFSLSILLLINYSYFIFLKMDISFYLNYLCLLKYLQQKSQSMLRNYKLLDLSRIIVGPYATMVLSDFGVNVIKVQSIEGDPTRQWGPPWHMGTSAYFHSVNRNKRSISLNLKQQKHLSVLYKLASKSDAIIENFVPGVTQNLKIDYQTIKKHKEDIVYCSISGYGDIGPLKNSPAFDNIIQAQSGFMHLTGSLQTEPFKMGFAISDVVTGLYAANAILAGLLQRERTKKGIHMKTSLYQCAMASLINQGSNFLNGKTSPKRMGNHHPNIVPYGLYNTKDSQVLICVGTPQHYQSMIKALQIQKHEHFATNELRVQNRVQFDKFLNNILGKMQVEFVIKVLRERSVPCGKVNSIEDAFNSNLSKQLKIVKQIDNIKYVRSPIRFQGEYSQSTRTPSLNEHAKEILQQVGYNDKEIYQIMNENK